MSAHGGLLGGVKTGQIAYVLGVSDDDVSHAARALGVAPAFLFPGFDSVHMRYTSTSVYNVEDARKIAAYLLRVEPP